MHALPQASIAVMGPEAAVNAVYYNKIQERPEADRAAYVEALRQEYREDVDIYKLAADLHVDAVLPATNLRTELIRRFAASAHKRTSGWPRKRSVTPV